MPTSPPITQGQPSGPARADPGLLCPSAGVWGLSCRQNAELAKLRQELSKVSKELVEKSEAARQEEQQRKALETKTAAFEKQILQLQVSVGSSLLGALYTPLTKPLESGDRPELIQPPWIISLAARILTAGGPCGAQAGTLSLGLIHNSDSEVAWNGGLRCGKRCPQCFESITWRILILIP